MVINISGVWENVAMAHSSFVDQCIGNFLHEFNFVKARPHLQHEIEVALFLRQYRKKIANPNQIKLSRLVAKFDKRFPIDSKKRNEARALFEEIFDYASFARKGTKGWNAYSLCSGAKWIMCPYCHILGTETVIPDGSNNEYRPQLDHYYSKALYPFLALTLGNLIPCCSRCNGVGFKHQVDFSKIPHLDPLRDQENISFELAIKEPQLKNDPIALALRSPLNAYEIRVHEISACEKTKASINTFKLNGTYSPYVGEAFRISRRVMRHFENTTANSPSPPPTSYNLMVKQALNLNVELEDCLSFDISQRNAYKNSPTGKMQRDIYTAALKKWG